VTPAQRFGAERWGNDRFGVRRWGQSGGVSVEVPAPAFWLDTDIGHCLADDTFPCENNDTIAKFLDQGTSGKDFTAIGANQALYLTNQLNGYPIARFDGAVDHANGGDVNDFIFMHNGTSHVILMVFKTADVNPDTIQVLFDSNGLGWTNRGAGLAYDDRSGQGYNDTIAHFIANGGDVSHTISYHSDNGEFAAQTWYIVGIRYVRGAGDDSRMYKGTSLVKSGDEILAPDAGNHSTAYLGERSLNNGLNFKGDFVCIKIWNGAATPTILEEAVYNAAVQELKIKYGI